MAKAEIEKTLAEEVDELVQSKKLAVTGVFGKSSLFDLATHSDMDYTVEGRLTPRWCNDNEPNIAAKRLQGYKFPEEISPRLKNLRRGGQVLMLRHADTTREHRAAVEKDNRAWEGKAFNKNERAAARGFEGFEIQRPDRR